jgi:hypothetical protein
MRAVSALHGPRGLGGLKIGAREARSRCLGLVIRPIRTLISLTFIAALVWCSFHVPLGNRTFSEHIDRIGRTPEARELLDGTRSTVNPAIEEATDRLLGEHIVAPTRLDAGEPESAPPPKVPNRDEEVQASTARRLPRAYFVPTPDLDDP